ncbi:MAG: LacI family DNA-binding transcriptional regulator [Hyphomonas sp.]|nr:LacI family DNA-binding transcriptional regulator [Hyphomonas sp.]MCB9962922.1 LacI family DNA-binding transcriptional regulator [Hyphomonas sp.]
MSPATVSRAFSDPGKLSKDTLKRVLKAAEELNYKPNSMAQLFRIKRTNAVLVMVPDVANVLFARILSGIERIATEKDYFLLVSDTKDDPEVERAGLEMVETRRADGVIQLGERGLGDLIADPAPGQIPFVQAVETRSAHAYPIVQINNFAAAESMASYLLSLGHRKIGVLAGLQDRYVTSERLRGFRSALDSFGIGFDENLVEYGAYSMAGGAQAALRLLSRNRSLTALFTMSDEMAIGAIRTAQDLGMQLPHDLSVTGFDNIEFGKYCTPPLTTVMQPAERIGEVAMTLMGNLLRGEITGDAEQTLGTELVIRASVRRLT